MIQDRLQSILSSIPNGVQLVAVSKTKPLEDILEVYEAGQRIFGENKVQELVEKHETLPKDIQWHYIGHLQRNKVKYIAPFVSLIHGVDSERLLREIDKEAAKNQRVIECLLQIHIADESTKFGLTPGESKDLLSSDILNELPNVKIVGLMGMATYTEDEAQISREFSMLGQLLNELKTTFYSSDNSFQILSMGMSGDYQIAIQNGSNMIRVGSSIFGERNYPAK